MQMDYTTLKTVLRIAKWVLNQMLTRFVTHLDIFVQSFFLFGFSGVATIGIHFAIPYLYSNYSETTNLLLRILGFFLVFQMLVNWLCIKYVDTSYQPYRDGIMPDGISIGQNISRTGDGTENGNNNARPRKDATSLNIGQDDKEESAVYEAKSTADPEGKNPYPYLSWVPCVQCNRPRPPRCYHCPICKKCVLKRDHHCFFTGVCIGTKNFRHFIVFIFWSFMAALFGIIHALPFYYYGILPYTSYFDLFFPIAITRALFGFIDWKYACCIVFGWILIMCLLFSRTYLVIVIKCISSGKTLYEIYSDVKIKDTRTKTDKLKAIFGQYWKLNFLFPLHFIFEPIDDCVQWPTIEA